MPGSQSPKQGSKPGAQQGPAQQQQAQPGLQRRNAIGDRNNAQVGALMRTTAERSLESETLQERQQFVADNKKGILDDLVGAATKKLTASLSAKMNKVIAAKKKEILESAQAAVQAELDKSAHAGEKPDLQAQTLVAESQAWTDAASAAGSEATTLVGTKDPSLRAAAESAFTVTGTSFKIADRPTFLAQITAEAKRLIDAKAKLVEVELTAEANKKATQDQVVGAATNKAKGAATTGNRAEGEISARHAAEDAVKEAAKPPVDAAAKEIRTATQTYLEKGLGAHGTGWFRSAQFKAFHTKMKEKAREKGHEETDKAIKAKRDQGGAAAGHEAELEYQTVQAHALTHDAAKLELRQVMKTFAENLLKQTGDEVKLDTLLGAPATAAAWATLRKAPANTAGAAKAAASAVKAAKPEVLSTFHKKAQELKNAYVKVGDDPTAQAQVAKNNEVVDKRVNPALEKADTKGKTFGQRMLTQAMEAPSASKGLQLVGKLIDAACPQVGDSTELEVELKIPASHGAFCYFTVTGSAERSAHMELGIDIAFGAGWETWGLSARGGFKVFLKAAAADTVNAMQLIHYGAFRNLTHASNNAANFWAGVIDPSKTGVGDKQFGKHEQAELWAAMTEERAFGKDQNAYVEVGGGIAGGATLKAGIEGEVSGELTSARRWDKEVFDKVEQEKTATGQDAGHGAGKIGGRKADDARSLRTTAAKAKREAVAKNVKRINRFQFGTSITAEANGQKFSIGLEATYTGGEGWEIEATGAIPYDPSQAGSSTLVSKIAGSYVPAALSGVKKIVDAYKAKQNKSGDGTARVGGGVADAGEDVLNGLDAGGMTGDLLKKLAEANPQNMEAEHADGINDTARLWLGNNFGLKGAMGEHGDMSQATSAVEAPQPFGATSQLEIALLIERPDEKDEATKWAFKVSRSKELKAGADLGAGLGLTAKLTRKQEIGGIAGKGLEKPRVFGGGSEAWVSTAMGGGTTGGGGQGGHP